MIKVRVKVWDRVNNKQKNTALGSNTQTSYPVSLHTSVILVHNALAKPKPT
jgi:hypothetical protein